MVYKIPMEDVKSLAEAFSQLESGESHTAAIWDITADSFSVIYLLNLCLSSAKQSFNFEEYNFSQSTLEQVSGKKLKFEMDAGLCMNTLPNQLHLLSVCLIMTF